MLRKIGMFCLVFVLCLVGVIGVAFLLSRCTFTPIEPLPKEEHPVTLAIETSTTAPITTTTLATTSTVTSDTTYTTTQCSTTTTPDTIIVSETVSETVCETQVETTAFVSTVLETTTQETTTYIETTIQSPFNDKRVKIDMGFRGSYYTGGWCTTGGSQRTLIPYNTTDEIRGSVASYYLWSRYKYDLGGRTKIYIEVPQFPEMNGYYYLDDCCSESLPNTIDFFCYNSNPCPLMLPIEKPIGVTFDIQCWIVEE